MKAVQLDEFDKKILRHLQENGRATNIELSEAVGLSQSPCLRRVRKLEEENVIKNYVTIIDQEAVGLFLNVFVSVTLEKQDNVTCNGFLSAIEGRAEIIECYLLAGDTDYMLRVVARDLNEYQQFLTTFLTSISGVSNVKSSFAIKQVSFKATLPLD